MIHYFCFMYINNLQFLKQSYSRWSWRKWAKWVKWAIKDVIRFNPDDTYYCINNLLLKLQQAVPSIKLFTNTDQDIEIRKNMLPKLERINGTAKCHEVLCINNKMIMKQTSNVDKKEFKFTLRKVSHLFSD